MDETKVQIGEDVLLDIGTHSDWYISAVSYDGESVNVDLRRKAARHKEWWLADTPQTDCDKCIWNVCNYNKVDWDADNPLTDAEITEFAKEIVHKMIDNSDIAEDAYPDLRQRMHDAVERLDEYYPSEDERGE